MNIFVFLSFCIALSLGCSNLSEVEVCNRPEGDCSCQAGLACKLTKRIIYRGETITVKQCIRTDVEIEVETVDLDNESSESPRNKRWLFNNGLFSRCSDESDCKENYCCAFNRRCLPKIWKYFTCSLTNLHKCGCRNGLECRHTATITLPISKRKIPIRQCMEPEA